MLKQEGKHRLSQILSEWGKRKHKNFNRKNIYIYISGFQLYNNIKEKKNWKEKNAGSQLIYKHLQN